MNNELASTEFVLDAGVFHPDSVLAAAHVMTRSMRVWLKPEGKKGTVVRVGPREGGAADAELESLFREEAAAQELRRRVSAANKGLREYVVTQALLSAAGERPEANGPALSKEEDAEIDRLISEVEAEIAEKAARFDPAPTGTTWEESGGRSPEGPESGKAP